MAALDLQEQEQIEALKAWWNDNGRWIIGIVLAAAIAAVGWRGWHYYQQQQSLGAATLYQQVTDQLASRDPKRINDAAEALMSKFSSTIYASRAALLAARVNEQNSDLARAKTQLQWVIDHSSDPAVKDVARLRLAAVFLDEKNYADALNALDSNHLGAFDGLFADMRGDVLSAQGKVDEARSSYKLAYEKLDPQSMYRNLVQIKLDALGTSR
jgi:predicted negative regulator of RcsB-dependent stress response